MQDYQLLAHHRQTGNYWPSLLLPTTQQQTGDSVISKAVEIFHQPRCYAPLRGGTILVHPAATVARRVFHDTNKVHAFLNLCLFLLLVLPLLYGGNFLTRQLLPGANLATLFFVREIRTFLTFFCATWIMGWIEGRNIAEYGLPWRLMFGRRFWTGALFGFASLTCLLLAIYSRIG